MLRKPKHEAPDAGRAQNFKPSEPTMFFLGAIVMSLYRSLFILMGFLWFRVIMSIYIGTYSKGRRFWVEANHQCRRPEFDTNNVDP